MTYLPGGSALMLASSLLLAALFQPALRAGVTRALGGPAAAAPLLHALTVAACCSYVAAYQVVSIGSVCR